ncbi:MAG: adenylate/guanylate cyclase domain-containing protein [Mycobacteriales bacterium]
MTEPTVAVGAALLEQALLGGARRYTRAQVAAESGVPVEQARLLWRALGFADAADDEAVFTDGDIEALRLVRQLERDGFVEASAVVSMARAMARSLGRLADWQVAELRTSLAAGAGALSEGDAAALAAEVVPVLERLMSFVWRRQLAAAAGRALAASPAELDAGGLAVGFADLVSFTALTRRMQERALAELVDRFESLAMDAVSGHGGRIVKTVGDEVLFVNEAPDAAAVSALELVDRIAAEELLPPVRAGVAFGTVLSRLGDVYGPVVNLASRLTSIARPGTVLVDLALAAELQGDPRFRLRRLRARPVHGFDHLVPTLLRRG